MLRPAPLLERLTSPCRQLAPPTRPPVYSRACPSWGLLQPESAMTTRSNHPLPRQDLHLQACQRPKAAHRHWLVVRPLVLSAARMISSSNLRFDPFPRICEFRDTRIMGDPFISGCYRPATERNDPADPVDCGAGADRHGQRGQVRAPSSGSEPRPTQNRKRPRTLRPARIPIYG
jgi:hypothetical protein